MVYETGSPVYMYSSVYPHLLEFAIYQSQCLLSVSEQRSFKDQHNFSNKKISVSEQLAQLKLKKPNFSDKNLILAEIGFDWLKLISIGKIDFRSLKSGSIG